MPRLPLAAAALLAATLPLLAQQPHPIPSLEHRGGHDALLVDGQPFLMLGAQINNSSSWPSTLPEVWPALEQMHVNTAEAPVYWEQLEPTQGHFDFSGVDLLVQQARQHNIHLVLLWFGTWKNGQNHYVPQWVKANPQRFPREVTPSGKLIDVMSPNAAANRDADVHAFTALMHHLREIDEQERTVLMIQVENESGSVGSVRDFSAEANRQFAQPVPREVAGRFHARAGATWSSLFGPDADERFAAWSTASYINAVARAGKAEYPLPMYCNVWITYPVHALENRDHPSPGQEYPSGGAQQGNIDLWKLAAPSIDVLAPDFYSDSFPLFEQVVAAYHRPDNPLFVPETGFGPGFGRYLFYALGHGAIGFSPFGVDFTNWTMGNLAAGGPYPGPEKLPASLSDDVPLLAPISRELAALNLRGTLQTAVEQKGESLTRLHFGDVDAVVGFGFPQHDGQVPPGTSTGTDGRVLVAQLGPDDFLVTGFSASVRFELKGAPTAFDPSAPATTAAARETGSQQQIEILAAEEGTFATAAGAPPAAAPATPTPSAVPGLPFAWLPERIWNGDQTDRGLNFPAHNHAIVRIRLHRLPLQAGAAR